MDHMDPLHVFEEIIRDIGHAIVIVDTDGRIRFANPHALRVTEFQADQLTGRLAHTLFEHNGDVDLWNTPARWAGVQVLCTPAGSHKNVTVTARTLRDIGPDLGMLISFSEEHPPSGNIVAVQPTDQFLKLMIGSRDVLYIIDAGTREFTYLDPSFESVFGYTVDDIREMGEGIHS